MLLSSPAGEAFSSLPPQVPSRLKIDDQCETPCTPQSRGDLSEFTLRQHAPKYSGVKIKSALEWASARPASLEKERQVTDRLA